MSNEEQLDKADFHYLDYSKGNVAWTIQSYGNEFDGGLMTMNEWMNEWMNESLFSLKLYSFYNWEKIYEKTHVNNNA